MFHFYLQAAVAFTFAGFARSSQFSTCLHSVSGLQLATASSSQYAQDIKPYNLRLSPSPVAVVFPSSVAQIQSAVKCAHTNGRTVSVRSGGHSYAAYGLAGDVVVDMRKLTSITLDSSGSAVAQTGNKLGELAVTIWSEGGRGLPHGTCPYVGTGGHTSFGGFGFFSRKAGLLLDRVTAADVILGNGTRVTASATSHSDLFWALRGAGASFGLVVAWTFATLVPPPTTVDWSVDFSKTLTETQIVDAWISWQQNAQNAPDELATVIDLGPNGAGGLSLSMEGSYYGTLSEFNTLMKPFFNTLPSSKVVTAKAYDWIDGLTQVDGNLRAPETEPDTLDTFFAKSLVTTSPVSKAAIQSWISYCFTHGASRPGWFAQADLYGGQISRVAKNATAFVHRDAFLVFQLYESQSPFPSSGITFVNNMLTALEPNPQGAYANYVDPTLADGVWQQLYYGSNYPRLQKIKTAWDPKNVFAYPQSTVFAERERLQFNFYHPHWTSRTCIASLYSNIGEMDIHFTNHSDIWHGIASKFQLV